MLSTSLVGPPVRASSIDPGASTLSALHPGSRRNCSGGLNTEVRYVPGGMGPVPSGNGLGDEEGVAVVGVETVVPVLRAADFVPLPNNVERNATSATAARTSRGTPTNAIVRAGGRPPPGTMLG